MHLGLAWELFECESGESTPRFSGTARPRIGSGAFAIACIYLYEGTGYEYSHWITLGRWKHGRIWALDSAWYPTRYSMTPDAFDECEWGNEEDGMERLLGPSRNWHKNYEEWLPGREFVVGTYRSLPGSFRDDGASPTPRWNKRPLTINITPINNWNSACPRRRVLRYR